MVWSGRILPACRVRRAWVARRAEPQTSPITDSNYSIELYDGVAIGNTAVVGMGGATVALAIGTSGHAVQPVGAGGQADDRHRLRGAGTITSTI